MKRYTLNEDDLHEALWKVLVSPTVITELKWSVVGGKLTVCLFEVECSQWAKVPKAIYEKAFEASNPEMAELFKKPPAQEEKSP